MKIIAYFILLFLGFGSAGCVGLEQDKDTLFQVSTINALLNGDYKGAMTFGELKRHGTFGIGTFDGLDGEMIGLEGGFYQIKADGIAYPVPDIMTTPFAVVTVFEADRTVTVKDSMSYEGLQRTVDELLPDTTLFYAIEINGMFTYIKTRSVPRQKEPYPPLVEAVKGQTIFEFHDIKGAIVGFRCPDSVKGVNVPGYHFHFITADKKAGGHLLACQLQEVTITVDYTSQFHMVLPQQDSASLQSVPNKDRAEELKKVEQE
ncbi:MAG: alpha-acetolactate decarboxylase [Deltaproteobacteria bacterium RBG_13_52_11]|nr:MAG: alpha-acetolactate decarboxylase [Deltaproteobacteria bacterium RBG_13_52_11]